MATFLLDTSVIIDAINGKRDRSQLLKGLLEQGHLLACSPINVTEVYAGLRPKEETVMQELLESLEYYPITREIASLAGLLKRDYARKGVTLATTDVTIAAMALYHHLTLITDNLKHYPMTELSLYPVARA
jgi:predicted nucleic acid-binding protein